MRREMEQIQKSICSRVGAMFSPPDDIYKVGLSTSAMEGIVPINGLRHHPESGTTGWFIWGGDKISHDDEYFKPIHVYHLHEACPAALPYIALPPGWRFLIAPGYEDVWFDAELLNPSP